MPPSVSQPHQQDFINVGVSFNLVLSIFSSRAVAGRTAVVSKGVCAHLMPETHISDKPKNVAREITRPARRQPRSWSFAKAASCNLAHAMLPFLQPVDAVAEGRSLGADACLAVWLSMFSPSPSLVGCLTTHDGRAQVLSGSRSVRSFPHGDGCLPFDIAG